MGSCCCCLGDACRGCCCMGPVLTTPTNTVSCDSDLVLDPWVAVGVSAGGGGTSVPRGVAGGGK
eukprot:8771165-Alexandrium_andersonii.AAC.1